MIKEYRYINIREVLSRLHRNPLLRDTDIESIVQYTTDFINIFGIPSLYQNKEVELEVKDYRAALPCDLISIVQVKDKHSNMCLSSISDSFNLKECLQGDFKELKFKVLNTIIYTSFKEGTIIVSYKAIPVDEDGFPLLIDNSNFLKTLELYVKKEIYSNLSDLGKINPNALLHAELQYAWAAGQLLSEFIMPSISEMESITRMWNTLIPKIKEFDNGFKALGNREYLKI